MRRAAARTLVAAAFAAACAVPAAAGWWDAAGEARPATLDEIRGAPAKWKDVPASLVVRFAGAAELPAAEPGADALDGAEWRAFAVEGGDPVPGAAFTVRRGSAEDARLTTLRPGDQIRVRAAVRSVVGGKPVLEVLWISAADDALSPEEVATIRRAEDLIAKDNGTAAEPLLRSVLEARDLAPVLRAGLWRRIARAQGLQRNHKEAVASLRRVLAIDPSDAATARELRDVEAAADRAAAAADGHGRVLRPFPATALTDLPAPEVRLAAPDEPPAARAARAQQISQPAAPAESKQSPKDARPADAAPPAEIVGEPVPPVPPAPTAPTRAPVTAAPTPGATDAKPESPDAGPAPTTRASVEIPAEAAATPTPSPKPDFAAPGSPAVPEPAAPSLVTPSGGAPSLGTPSLAARTLAAPSLAVPSLPAPAPATPAAAAPTPAAPSPPAAAAPAPAKPSSAPPAAGAPVPAKPAGAPQRPASTVRIFAPPRSSGPVAPKLPPPAPAPPATEPAPEK